MPFMVATVKPLSFVIHSLWIDQRCNERKTIVPRWWIWEWKSLFCFENDHSLCSKVAQFKSLMWSVRCSSRVMYVSVWGTLEPIFVGDWQNAGSSWATYKTDKRHAKRIRHTHKSHTHRKSNLRLISIYGDLFHSMYRMYCLNIYRRHECPMSIFVRLFGSCGALICKTTSRSHWAYGSCTQIIDSWHCANKSIEILFHTVNKTCFNRICVQNKAPPVTWIIRTSPFISVATVFYSYYSTVGLHIAIVRQLNKSDSEFDERMYEKKKLRNDGNDRGVKRRQTDQKWKETERKQNEQERCREWNMRIDTINGNTHSSKLEIIKSAEKNYLKKPRFNPLNLCRRLSCSSFPVFVSASLLFIRWPLPPNKMLV